MIPKASSRLSYCIMQEDRGPIITGLEVIARNRDEERVPSFRSLPCFFFFFFLPLPYPRTFQGVHNHSIPKTKKLAQLFGVTSVCCHAPRNYRATIHLQMPAYFAPITLESVKIVSAYLLLTAWVLLYTGTILSRRPPLENPSESV